MANCNDTTSNKPTEVSNVIKANVNFTVLAGDTFDAVVKFKDAKQIPLNFTGATLVMEIRDDEDVWYATLEDNSGFTVNLNIVTFDYIVTLAAGVYLYELQCTFSSGLKKTLLGGKFKVLKETTLV